MSDPEYPAWICSDCGQKHGRRAAGICTFHVGECDICGAAEMVTEPRDYGHLKDGWQRDRATLAIKPTFKDAPEV